MSDQLLDLAKIAAKNGTKIPAVFPANTHICHFYRTKEDLLDLLIPYFREGLARKEFCLWGVTHPLTVEEAKAALGQAVDDIGFYLGTGQLEIFDVGLLYGSGPFDALVIRDSFLNKVKESLNKGWQGFRCDGITSGVNPRDWTNFQVYEEEVTRTLLGSVTALCSYNLADLTNQQVLAVADTHLASILKKENKWFILDAPPNASAWASR